MTQLAISPVLLTWNERPNIGRTLSRLTWAKRVLVVDSCSEDGTQELARRFENVTVVERPFDSHAAQWEFGIRRPEIATDWVLALDADYVLSEQLVAEIRKLPPEPTERGFRVPIRFCIEGVPLRASLYPPVVALFDRRSAHYVQEGHTHRVIIEAGPVGKLGGEILHDDRKPFQSFLDSQRRYAPLEAQRIRNTRWTELSWSGRIRKLRWIAPWLVPLFVLLGKGLVLDGRPGLSYARQRWIAERMIARELARGSR